MSIRSAMTGRDTSTGDKMLEAVQARQARGLIYTPHDESAHFLRGGGTEVFPARVSRANVT
jgi:hypothetical protein